MRTFTDLLRRYERVTVNRIVVCEGEGVHPDPVREVVYWMLDNGELLYKDDKWAATESLPPARPTP